MPILSILENIRFALSMRIALNIERIWHGMRLNPMRLMKVHSRRLMGNTQSFSG